MLGLAVLLLAAFLLLGLIVVELSLRVFLLFLLFVEASNAILPEDVAKLSNHSLVALAFQAQVVGLNAVFVKRNNLESAFGGDCHEICRHVLVGRICQLLLENVALEEVICSGSRFQMHLLRRKLLDTFDVGINLVVEAAFELCTLSGELLRIKRNVLKACGACCHRDEISHPT